MKEPYSEFFYMISAWQFRWTASGAIVDWVRVWIVVQHITKNLILRHNIRMSRLGCKRVCRALCSRGQGHHRIWAPSERAKRQKPATWGSLRNFRNGRQNGRFSNSEPPGFHSFKYFRRCLWHQRENRSWCISTLEFILSLSLVCVSKDSEIFTSCLPWIVLASNSKGGTFISFTSFC
jgi:hypothetical protein